MVGFSIPHIEAPDVYFVCCWCCWLQWLLRGWLRSCVSCRACVVVRVYGAMCATESCMHDTTLVVGWLWGCVTCRAMCVVVRVHGALCVLQSHARMTPIVSIIMLETTSSATSKELHTCK